MTYRAIYSVSRWLVPAAVIFATYRTYVLLPISFDITIPALSDCETNELLLAYRLFDRFYFHVSSLTYSTHVLLYCQIVLYFSHALHRLHQRKARSFFFTHAKLLAGRRCFIGCSGNFTIEQILTRVAPTAELHSNDVSLYSGVIGAALTQTPFPVRNIVPEMEWINDYLSEGPVPGPLDVSTVILYLEMLKYEKQKNDYTKGMWGSYLKKWPELHKKTLKKVETALSSQSSHPIPTSTSTTTTRARQTV